MPSHRKDVPRSARMRHGHPECLGTATRHRPGRGLHDAMVCLGCMSSAQRATLRGVPEEPDGLLHVRPPACRASHSPACQRMRLLSGGLPRCSRAIKIARQPIGPTLRHGISILRKSTHDQSFSEASGGPSGDRIPVGTFAELVSVGLDNVPTDAPAGCLPLFTHASGYVPTWAAPEGQQRLADRAQHVAWLAGAGRPDFPAVAVLRVATGATLRQACTAAGIDPDAPLVGIPTAAF